MNILLTLLILVSTIVVLMNSITLVAHLDRKLWFGQLYKFGGFSVSIALTAAGAVGILFGWEPASEMLMIGIAGRMIFDRRQ